MLQYTLVCSLLQPPPEVFELFDNILLLNGGYVAYFGSRAGCLAYFSSIGYDCPVRMDAADFIQQVSTDLGKAYHRTANTIELPSTSTPAEFHQAFKASTSEHKIAFVKPKPNSSFTPRKIDKSIWLQLRLVFSRQFKLVQRDKRFNRVRILQSSAFGLIIGSLFYQMGDDAKYVVSKAGLLFLTILFTSLTTMSNIAYTIEVRNIYIKQYFRLYPAILYALSEGLIEVAATVVQVFLFTATSYWMCGFSSANHGMHYGFYYVVVFLNSICICQLFKCCGAMASSRTTGLISAAMFLVSVFPAGLKWIYWLNPASWAYRALFQNEFGSAMPAYDVLHPVLKLRMGNYYMALMGVSDDLAYKSRAVVYLCGFYIAMVSATSFAYHFLKHEKGHRKSKPRSNINVHASRHRRASVLHVADQFPVEFTPVTLSFRNLHYSVVLANKKSSDSKYKTLELLHNVHGHCRPHTLTALMGSSGAGKSTLLDVLAGRKNSGTVQGELFVNGRPLTKQDQRRFGYVEQTDMHCMKTTVDEAFAFSARLRLSESAQRNAANIIHSTVALLVLGKDKHKRLTALSNEQLKRVTIGVELVANPSVLFLDEPTSGLDVHAAHIVMEAVKRIAAAGRTIVCTIHQPSQTLFELFDDLILLQTGGHQVYCGPIGVDSSDLLEHFASVPTLRRCNTTENPATFMLEVMTAHPQVDFAVVYAACPQRERILKTINNVVEQCGTGGTVIVKSIASGTTYRGGYATSFSAQFRLIFLRTATKYWRTTEYSFGRLGANLFVSLLLGVLFASNGLAYSGDVDSQMGLVFIAPLFMGIIAVLTGTITFSTAILRAHMTAIGLPVVDAERAVFFRENASGMYAPLAYSLAFGLVELPYVALNAVVFVAIFYNMVGLYPTSDAFGWFLLLFFCYTLYATYMGQVFVAALPDLRTATVVSAALNSVFSIFSGFFIHRPDIPVAWRFLYWISPLHYMMEGVMSTQFLQNPANISLGSKSTGPLSPQPVAVQAYVAKFFDGSISYDNRFLDLVAILVWIVSLRIFHALAMTFISHVTR
ncbi:unnamed protein product [Aphanomyces euteiches]